MTNFQFESTTRDTRGLSGMFWRRSLLMMILMAVVLAGVSGTYALLRAQAVVPGATITAGSSTILINDASTADLGSWTATPTSSESKAVKVTLTGDVDASVRLNVTATSSSQLTNYTWMRVTPVSGADQCANSLTGGRTAAISTFGQFNLPQMVPGQDVWLCVELGINAETPQAHSGQTVTFNAIVTAEQVVTP